MSNVNQTLRERTRRAVRLEIAEAALTLFLKDGFEVTTIESIAAAAGISRRSYFRYFASKEEALAEALAGTGDTITTALAQRPASEPAWTALRRSFDALITRAQSEDNAEALGRLMLERPDLQQGKDSRWRDSIADLLADRADAAPDDTALQSRAIASAAIACLNTAQKQWLDPHERRSLGTLLDLTMGAVRPL